MDQVSGGERAFIKLCLMVGIQQIQNWKIFVLDEVDQNLDAVRLQNLKDMLENMECQVFAVTHNTALAPFAEQVIGVTRREKEPTKIFWIKK